MVFVAMGMIYNLFEGLVASHFIPLPWYWSHCKWVLKEWDEFGERELIFG